MPDIHPDARPLWTRAIGDKLLIVGKIRYMLFFESDEPFRGGPPFIGPFKLFATRNGWHVVGHELATADEKRIWFAAWKAQYPDSDYKAGNWNWLRPHTREEAVFILSRSRAVPQTCRYYRDKEVTLQWL